LRILTPTILPGTLQIVPYHQKIAQRHPPCTQHNSTQMKRTVSSVDIFTNSNYWQHEFCITQILIIHAKSTHNINEWSSWSFIASLLEASITFLQWQWWILLKRTVTD
jgi:hypothetical protein